MTENDYQPSPKLRWVSLATLLIAWLLPALYYPRLPAEIPRHFDASGTPDAFGGKAFIWFLPLLGTVLFYGLGRVMRISYRPNNPWNNSPTAEHHHLGMEMTDWLRVLISAALAWIVWQTVRVGLGRAEGLGDWFLPIFLLAIFGTISYYVWRMAALGNEKKSST